MDPDESHLPTYESDVQAVYTLEVVAELTGVSSSRIVHYQEHGWIAPCPDSLPNDPRFDDKAIHALRRIDYLRTTCGVNESGLKLLLGLLDEVERLRAELRGRQRATN